MCPLPEFVVRELAAVPMMGPSIGSGLATESCKQPSLIGKAASLDYSSTRKFKKIGHAHRECRDTFAAELLLAGVPLERVAVLLGHSIDSNHREVLQRRGLPNARRKSSAM